LKLVARMTEIAADHSRWGYRMVHAALVEGRRNGPSSVDPRPRPDDRARRGN
jgi:hypothetical protein